MLKGAIDHISPNEIGGWIYSATASLRNHTVLAFIDDACIGAGRVELYREDLADAGLGDGFLGFKFPVNLASIDEAPLVVVKLEGSDAVIIQPSARLVRRTLSRPCTIVTARTLASIEWMRARAWLDQTEYDFLRMMFRFGVYDLSLRQGKPGERSGGNGLRDPLEGAQDMFDLLCNTRTEVATDVLTQDADGAPRSSASKRGRPSPSLPCGALSEPVFRWPKGRIKTRRATCLTMTSSGGSTMRWPPTGCCSSICDAASNGRLSIR